jgi:hypothetical protein
VVVYSSRTRIHGGILTVDSEMGLIKGSALGQCLGDEQVLMGRLWMFFLGETGRVRENVRSRSLGSVFVGRQVLSNRPIF